nr:MAG TPA: tail assembly protein [Caudoviricetes sp.]
MPKYKLYFSRDSTVLALPINPEKLPETISADNGKYNVLGLGQIMQPRTPDLRTVSISGLLPGRRLPGQTGIHLPPAVYMDFFTSAMKKKTPIVYTPVRVYENGLPFLGPSLGFPCLVTSFKTEERGGETGDFYFDLSLSEYRDFSPQRAVVQGEGQTGTFTPATAESTSAQTTARTIAASSVISTAASAASTVRLTLTPTRSTPSDRLVVNARRKASGSYYAASDGAESLGSVHGLLVTVRRIASHAKPCPVCVADASGDVLGWMAEADLQEADG